MRLHIYIMEIGIALKYILIIFLALAGYYIVTSAATVKRREGFSTDSTASDSPGVSAGKQASVLTDKAKNISNSLQLTTNRTSYENMIGVMDLWTQAKMIASLNALSDQMIADSTNVSSPPSEKTVALMNSLLTLTNFQTTAIPAAYKYLDGAN